MPLPRIMPSIRRENYAAIKRLAENDPDFPEFYDEWITAQMEEIAKLTANGITFEQVYVDEHQFAAYIMAAGLDANRVSFNATAVAIYGRPK